MILHLMIIHLTNILHFMIMHFVILLYFTGRYIVVVELFSTTDKTRVYDIRCTLILYLRRETNT